MKNVINVLIFFLIFCSMPLLAQNVQDAYQDAKTALLKGNVEEAQLQISVAYAMIDEDPNLDPNGNFKNRLLPNLEETAKKMAEIIKALDKLQKESRQRMSVHELPPTLESVKIYTRAAKNVGDSLIQKRDSILAGYELDSQYREALRKNSVFQQTDQFITHGIMDSLSQKFTVIADEMTDSLNQLNAKFNRISANLDKMKKSASANRADRQKLEEELQKISQERINYMNAISEMLAGETSVENPQLNEQILGDNVEGIFTEMIRSEIKRIKGLTEVDSATYKDLMKNYNLIENYNRIFLKNNISSDQSQLLGEYERAVRNIKVIQEKQYDPFLIGGIVAVLLVIIMIYLIRRPKPANKSMTPAKPSSPPTEPKK